MAVRFDADALHELVGDECYRTAELLFRSGRVDELSSLGGGAQGTVRDDDRTHQAWVGIVDQALTGECSCAETTESRWCSHTAALTLAAIDAGLRWSGAAQSPSSLLEEQERLLTAATAALDPEQLAELAVEYGLGDRVFATLLLTRAGLLDAPTRDELDGFGEVVDQAAAVPLRSRRQSDIVTAGRMLLEELDLLAVRRPSDELLAAVENAVEVWDRLAAHLYQHDPSGVWAAEIGRPLAGVHRNLCERLGPDPDRLGSRLAEIRDAVPHPSCVDLVDYGGLIAQEAGPVATG